MTFKIIDRIKNEPYFQWPNKMGGDPSWRNQNLYCTYRRDKGHTTEQCQVLKDHLGQLVKAGTEVPSKVLNKRETLSHSYWE